MEQILPQNFQNNYDKSLQDYIKFNGRIHLGTDQEQLSTKQDFEEIHKQKLKRNLKHHIENLHLFCETSNELIKKMEIIYNQYNQAILFRLAVHYNPSLNESKYQNQSTDFQNLNLQQLQDQIESQCFEELENGVLFVKNFEILNLIQQTIRENRIVKPQIDFQTYFGKQILDNYDSAVFINLSYRQINFQENNYVFDQDQESKALEHQATREEILLKINSVQIVQALKRILKATKIQIEDFQAGIFQFSTVTLSQDGLGGINVQETIKNMILNVELNCEFWLDMWSQKFKSKNKIQINLEQIPQIFSGIQNGILNELQFQIKSFVNGQYIKQENSSIIDIFPEFFSDQKIVTSQEFQPKQFEKKKRDCKSNILILCLLQLGNTIDGITISSKILERHISHALKSQQKASQTLQQCNNQTECSDFQIQEQIKQEVNSSSQIFNSELISKVQSQQLILNKFFEWKKRRCHGCLEFMVEACKTVVCFNIIKSENPCKKLYCLNCTTNYFQQKQKLSVKDYKENGKVSTQQNFELQEKQKRAQNTALKKNLKQRAFQNVLFTCPCCQDDCIETYQENNSISLCKLNKIIDYKPLQLLQRHILIFLDQKIMQQQNQLSKLIQSNQFVLAQIIGYDKPKKLFKIVLTLNGKEAINNPDKLNDYKSEEEQYFDSTLSQQNIYFMFLSTILQHSDFSNLKDNQKGDSQHLFQDQKLKKTQISRLYKMLNSAINNFDKQDEFSIQSFADEHRIISLDVKAEIQEGISALKKSEGKEFGYLQRYSEHLSDLGGLDYNQTFSQQFHNQDYLLRKEFVQNIRQSKLQSFRHFNSSENEIGKIVTNLDAANQNQNSIEVQKQQEEQKIQSQPLEIQFKVDLNNNQTNFTQQDKLIQDLKNNLSISENGHKIVSECTEKDFNKKVQITKDQTDDKINSQPNITSQQISIQNYSCQQDQDKIQTKDKEDAKVTQKRFIVPVVKQKKLENIQKQLEKEFRKIEKLKNKQSNQDAIQSQLRTQSFHQREKEVIQKSEHKIDRLLKQENSLQSHQHYSKNQELCSQNGGLQATQLQEFYRPKEIQIHQRKNASIDDPENLRQDSLNQTFLLVQKSRIVDGKMYLKRFKINKRLKMHYKFLREYALLKPEDFIGLIIYKKDSQQNLWYRSKILNFLKKEREEEQKTIIESLQFETQLLNKERQLDCINTSSDIFIIDQSQDLTQTNEPQTNSISNNKRQRKIIQLNENEFNDFGKLQKILLKEQQRNEKGLSLKEAVYYEDPQLQLANQYQLKQNEESKLEQVDRKRKKQLIVIQTNFPFSQRVCPQVLQPGQRKWLSKMKSTPRNKHMNDIAKIQHLNTPTFKNMSSVDQQIYYSDINSEDAYDQQSLNIDNHRSIDQLKIHYCKEIVQYYQQQQSQLNVKQYVQKPNHEFESQSNLNTMDIFLATQKQMNQPNLRSASIQISIPSQPISNYENSSCNIGGAANQKNTNLTISAETNEVKKKAFSKGAIEDRIRQSVGKRKQIQTLFKLLQQRKLRAQAIDEANLNLVNQKQFQPQIDYIQAQNHQYINLLQEIQKQNLINELQNQQNINQPKQQFGPQLMQNINPFVSKQMVVQIPQQQYQVQNYTDLQKQNNQNPENKIILADQQYDQMPIQSQLQIESNSLIDKSQIMPGDIIDSQQLNQQFYLQNQELDTAQKQNEAVTEIQADKEVMLQNLNCTDNINNDQDFTKQLQKQNQFKKNFIQSHLQTLGKVARNQQFIQTQLSDQHQQQTTLPSTWHYQFYEKKGFKKCQCETCKNVPYPALISSNANPNDQKLVEAHKQYFQDVEVHHQMIMLQQQDQNAKNMANQGLICQNTSSICFTQDADIHNKFSNIQLSDFMNLQNIKDICQDQHMQSAYNDELPSNALFDNLNQNYTEQAPLAIQAGSQDQQNADQYQVQQQNNISNQQSYLSLATPEEKIEFIQHIENQIKNQKEQYNFGQMIYEKGYTFLKEQEEQLKRDCQIYNYFQQNEQAQLNQDQIEIKLKMEKQITQSQQDIFNHQVKLNHQYISLILVGNNIEKLQSQIDYLCKQNDLQLIHNSDFVQNEHVGNIIDCQFQNQNQVMCIDNNLQDEIQQDGDANILQQNKSLDQNSVGDNINQEKNN